MNDFLKNVVAPIIFFFVVFSVLIVIIQKFDDAQIKKIDALVNKNELQVYENCWKLEGKYYCKN